MDEDEDRRVGPAGPVNVELFDSGRSVERTLRGADTGAHCIAVAVKALAHLSNERFVIDLVVRRIEFELIVIHEHQGPLVMLRRSHRTSIGESRRGHHRGGRSKHGSAADLLHFDPPYGRTVSRRWDRKASYGCCGPAIFDAVNAIERKCTIGVPGYDSRVPSTRHYAATAPAYTLFRRSAAYGAAHRPPICQCSCRPSSIWSST
jgi:hypothetical protein